MPNSASFPIAAAATIGCIFFAVSYMRSYKQKTFSKAFWLKGGAAFCFVFLGMWLSLQTGKGPYARLLIIGLLLGLCGDQILALRFLRPRFRDLLFAAGAGAFAAGHFFYIKALYGLGGVSPVLLIPVFLAGIAIANIYGKHQGSNAGSLQIPAVLYMALVIFMGSVAISAFWAAPGFGLLLFAIGGICFSISDNILFAYSFGKSPCWSMNIWVHITYYAAQLLIAWSIFFVT